MDLRDVIPAGFDCMVYSVPVGTVVGQDVDGNDMVVTETAVVHDGDKWFVTETVFQEIKRRTAKRLS